MNQQDKDRLRALAQKDADSFTATRQSTEIAAGILSLLEENWALEAKLNDLQTMYRVFRRDYDRYNDGEKSMPFHLLRRSLDALIREHEHAMQHKGD